MATFLTQGGDERGVAFRVDDPETARLESYESTKLHAKTKELERVDDQLAQTKEQYEQRCMELKAREKEFLDKQADMIESIRKFKGFIVETDTKRHRALVKAGDEHRTVQRHAETAAALRQRLETLRAAQRERAAEYAALRPYREYLEGVVRLSDEFEDIGELTTRYKILSQTHADLRHEAARVQEEVETTQAELQALRKAKQNEVLVQNSTIARLQKALEDESRAASNLESEVEAREYKARDTAARFGQIDMAIRNLFERVEMSRQHKKKGRGKAAGAGPGTATAAAAVAAAATTTKTTKTAKGSESEPASLKQRQARQLAFYTRLLGEIGGRVVELQDIAAMHTSKSRAGGAE